MESLANLGSNVLSDLVFWLSSGLACWLLILVAERRFVKLFGAKHDRTLKIYLSNLWDRESTHSYTPIVSGHEFQATRAITQLFGDAPFRMPDIARGLVDSFFAKDRLDWSFVVSPLDPEEIAFSNMIVIGASPKNSVRRYCLAAGLPYLAFIGEDVNPPAGIHASGVAQGVRILKGPRVGETIEGRYSFAIVEKSRDEKHNAVVITCAGVRADGSWAATEYLVRHWKELAKAHGEDWFAICLGFPVTTEYMNSYVEPRILETLSASDPENGSAPLHRPRALSARLRTALHRTRQPRVD